MTPLDNSKVSKMKNKQDWLRKILELLILDSHDHGLGLDDVDDINLNEATQAIKDKLLELLPEKHVCDKSCDISSNEWEIGHRAYRDAESNVLEDIKKSLGI